MQKFSVIHTVVTRSWIGIVHICYSHFYFCGANIENRRHLWCLRFCFLGFVSIFTMLPSEETGLLFILKTPFQEVGQVVCADVLGRDAAILLHHYVMRNAVEAEELAHVFVVRVRQAVAGLPFQMFLYIVRIGFLGRLPFAGDVDELELRVVAVLLAQVGRRLYASPARTTGGGPEVDEQHLARWWPRSRRTAPCPHGGL